MTHYFHSSSDCFVNSPHPEYQVELSETGGDPTARFPSPLRQEYRRKRVEESKL